MGRLLAVVGACGLAVVTVLSSTRAAPVPESSAEALVARLGSPRFADREAATRLLEAMGSPAIPALEQAIRSSDLEISRRAAMILVRARRQADSSQYLAPRKIKLSYQNIPLGTALNDLKARTGINLTLDPDQVANPLRPVTVETGELPPWEAVDAFCKAAGLREVFISDLPVPKSAKPQGRGYFTPPPPPPGADAVPVTLADGKHQAIPGSRTNSVRVLALPRSFPGHRVFLGTGDIVVSFDITPTPGLNWQEVSGVRITKLIDDAGRIGTGGTLPKPEIAPFDHFGGGGMMMIGGPGGRIVAMRWDPDGNPILPTEHPNPRIVPVPLKIATPAARSIRLLEGAVVGEIVVQDKTIAIIDKPAQRQGATITGVGGKVVTVQEVAKSGADGVTFRIELRSESPQQRARGAGVWVGQFWPDQLQPTGSGVQLSGLDTKDKPLTAASMQMTGINDDGFTQTVQLSATFRDVIPSKLVVSGPATVAVEVPFRMENVPLP